MSRRIIDQENLKRERLQTDIKQLKKQNHFSYEDMIDAFIKYAAIDEFELNDKEFKVDKLKKQLKRKTTNIYLLERYKQILKEHPHNKKYLKSRQNDEAVFLQNILKKFGGDDEFEKWAKIGRDFSKLEK